MGFERIQTVLADVLNIPLSEGGAVAILERAGAAAQPAAAAIGECVRQSPVIGSDETSARVNGRNWWEWVFLSSAGEYHVIQPSRGQDVIDEFMGDHCAEVWHSDCWKPQLNAPTKQHQLCLSHQIRNLQGLIDQRPRLTWAQALQDLFRACERALRPSVIHRKVMGSFRSEWGPKAYAALASVLNTAKRSGVNVFQTLVTLMGKPVLPYLVPSIS
jgi:transposase